MENVKIILDADVLIHFAKATDELINKEFYRPPYPQKSLLLPPVRYFRTSTTSAMKIMIAKNMVWSSYIFWLMYGICRLINK